LSTKRISIIIIRKIYTRKFGGEKIKLGRGNIAEIIILSFVGLGMVFETKQGKVEYFL